MAGCFEKKTSYLGRKILFAKLNDQTVILMLTIDCTFFSSSGLLPRNAIVDLLLHFSAY